jgi:hypothetical protein
LKMPAFAWSSSTLYIPQWSEGMLPGWGLPWPIF